MARTQMRLDAITGSLSSAESEVAALDAASLQDVMDHLASGIKRLHGGSAFHSQEAGLFSQNIRTTGNMDVDLNLNVDGNALVDGAMYVTGAFHGEGAASMGSTLAVAGNADLNGALDVAGAVSMAATGVRTLLRGDLKVDEAADLDGALDVAGRVDLGAAGGAADTFVRGDLSVAEDASITGDLTVAGDFRVNGALTYVDTTNLVVADAKIVVSSGSLVDGAGLYLGNDSSGENLRWSTADGGKWIASDKFAADTMQALDLSEAIVWADASGNLMELQAADFGSYLSAGAGIDSVASGQIDATPYVAGTGVIITNFTASIGQAVAITDSVEFAGITDSSLTASRLMASDASKGLVSADLAAWVAGTANQVSVADDADGSITLSLPQDIHAAASPRFAKVELDGADNYVDSDADGLVLHAALAGDSIKFEYDAGKSISLGTEALSAGFTATDIMGALNELKTGAVTFFKKHVDGPKAASTDFAVHADFDHTIDNADQRIDVYVNGQLLRKTEDYAYGANANEIQLTFALLADDVCTVISR